jgi:hypothetical protein
MAGPVMAGIRWRDDLRAALPPWVLARAITVASLAAARFAFDDIGDKPRQLSQGLFAWDAAFYRGIAEHGYGSVRETVRFFPLVPLAARWLGVLVGGNDAFALLVIANGSALAFGVLLHRIVRRETGDGRLAGRATWFAAVFPTGFVLVMGYAEATFLALAAGFFLALRERRWWWAGLAGLFAGLTRPTGVLLVVPAVIEIARAPRPHRNVGSLEPLGAARTGLRAATRELPRAVPVVAPLLGTAVYLGWVGEEHGDTLLPFRLQNDPIRRGGSDDPFTRFVEGVGDLVGGDRFGSGLHVVWAIAFVALVVVLARQLPASYAAFGGATVLLGLSADNLDSFERYAMNAFPLVVAVALVARPREVERMMIAAAAAGMLGYAVLAFTGQYVP